MSSSPPVSLNAARGKQTTRIMVARHRTQAAGLNRSECTPALADYKVPARPGLRLGHSQGTIDKSNYAVMPYFTAQRTWMSDIRRIGPDKGHYSAKRHGCSEYCSASGLVYQ
ncbi:hypothetical protein RRG08_062155 [Elysia crispata]|uniref:Uncharacterized protein n=1 Tax=Elysia crispata TaxID=231223 RepID=A0AAE1DPH3_9GAST|nr:hypothetical protein RRG08_062155 [Elysia crispata]